MNLFVLGESVELYSMGDLCQHFTNTIEGRKTYSIEA
jgi:hypothetical protein